MPKQGERRWTLALKAKDGREYEFVLEIGRYEPPAPKAPEAPPPAKAVERCWLLRGPERLSKKDEEGYPTKVLAHAETDAAKEVTGLKAKLPDIAKRLGLVVPKGAMPWKAGIVDLNAPLDSKGQPKPAALPLKPEADVKLRVDVPDAAVPLLQEQLTLSHAIARNRAQIGEALRLVEEAKAELKDRQADVAELEQKEKDLFDSMLDVQRDLEHGQTRLVFKAVDAKPPAKKKAAKKAAAKKAAAKK